MSRNGYHQQQGESEISSQQPDYYVPDEESAILDAAILDNDMMSSPEADLRRGSVASNGVMTAADSHAWRGPYGGLPNEVNAAVAHYPHHEEHNGFVRPHPPHVQTFIGQPQPQQWPFDHGSGHCTPTTAGTYISPHDAPQFYEGQGHAYVHHQVDSARGSFSHHGQHPFEPPQQFHPPPEHAEQLFIPAPQAQTPMSPHSHQDWKAMAQNELNSRPRRMRPASHTHSPRTTVDLQRSSGVRKKNARIEIPEERNIQTIDEQLEHEDNDEIIKELKQQKRLLRNREAALASRQRKKRHTEELEHKEKEYHNSMHSLQTQVSNLRIALANEKRINNDMICEVQGLRHQSEVLKEEHRNTVLRHNEETSMLRKRIELLTEQLEAGPAPAMSAQASSIGFAAEMEALNVADFSDMPGWEDLIHDVHGDVHDDLLFGLKPEPVMSSPILACQANASVTTARKKSPDPTSEPPAATGLLFFLLLCGAFVASKPAISRPADMPEVPENVRAAAPAVLENLLQEAAPLPSPAATRSISHTSTGAFRSQTGPNKRSRLDQVHQRITSPTKQQEHNEAFSLSTAQYASISDPDHSFSNNHARYNQAQHSRPNLAEVLSRSREEYMQSSKAEVYTRSLLWERIPAETVRQFKDMVKANHERQQMTSNDDDDDGLLYANMKTEA